MILTMQHARKESRENERTEDYADRKIRSVYRSPGIAGFNLLWKRCKIYYRRKEIGKLREFPNLRIKKTTRAASMSRGEIIAPFIHHRARMRCP